MIKDAAKCQCKNPEPSGVFMFGAETCRKCKRLIEPMGEKGCGVE